MEFTLTPKEVWPLAEAAGRWLRSRGLKVRAEEALAGDAPGRSTLLGVKHELAVLVEIRTGLSYLGFAQNLVRYLWTRRACAEFYMGIREDGNASLGALKELERDGVGLLLISRDGSVHESRRPKNPALQVSLNPRVPLGRHKEDVGDIYDMFNSGERKPAMEAMVEFVEGRVERVGCKAVKKGYVLVTEAQFRAADFSGRINMLASDNQAVVGKGPVFSETSRIDLQSFRQSRNLLKHPALGRWQALRRDIQFPERIHMGARLTSELLSIERKIK